MGNEERAEVVVAGCCSCGRRQKEVADVDALEAGSSAVAVAFAFGGARAPWVSEHSTGVVIGEGNGIGGQGLWT